MIERVKIKGNGSKLPLKIKLLRIAFRYHRKNARGRGIPFLLTYEQWLGVWLDSGHLQDRGRNGHQYVMARKGDRGPYAIGNVQIITQSKNISEGRTGKRDSLESRMKKSKAHTGVPRPYLWKDHGTR